MIFKRQGPKRAAEAIGAEMKQKLIEKNGQFFRSVISIFEGYMFDSQWTWGSTAAVKEPSGLIIKRKRSKHAAEAIGAEIKTEIGQQKSIFPIDDFSFLGCMFDSPWTWGSSATLKYSSGMLLMRQASKHAADAISDKI